MTRATLFAGVTWVALVAAAPRAAEVFPVKRGDNVVLVTQAGGIRLSAPGRALKNGRAGETIPVYNAVTGRGLHGVVRDGWVEIPPAGEIPTETHP
jgi:flagella basal body P-ring formation protein FlgA